MNSKQPVVVRSPEDRRKFRQLQFVRAALGVLMTFFLAHLVEFGVETGLLAFAVVCGISFSGLLLLRGKQFVPVLLYHAALYVAVGLLLNIANRFVLSASSSPSADFLIPSFAADAYLVFWFYAAGFLATWAFWTRGQAVTFEALAASGFLVWLLSGHRNYRLDSPKQLSSLSWKIEYLQQINAQPQHLILAVGVLYVLLLIGYLLLASNRPVFGQAKTIKSFGPRQKAFALLCPLILLAALAYYAWFLNTNYAVNIARASNGVGPSSDLQEGESNLGFNSAVTATRQPAAILRLEGDYVSNPTAPMLYLREGALSTFNQTELVKAPLQYDTDIPRVGLGQAFYAPDDEADQSRERLVQSIYLISQHSAPFAVDVPKRYRPIRNPKPERFQFAYQALSLAPTTPLQEMVGMPVGDPEWDEATWQHYLRAPGSNSTDPIIEMIEGETLSEVRDETGEDARYRALSAKLTDGTADPIIKAARIVGYLSESSIYTRSPGHQIQSGADPVAPYLFSDNKKGYCVHFAHAAVYLMRLAGIPARIATGYQTDLTYAKDGHVLLMMGDRHAWPEIYVQGKGWTVFDVTPAQAENEPELVPDENLLEQLMSELDPAPEFIDPLPEDELASDKEDSIFVRAAASKLLIGLALLAIAAVIAFKLYLLFGYRFVKDSKRKVRLAYLSFATRMHDRALPRHLGETRKEYAQRLQESHGVDAHRITELIEKSVYAPTLEHADNDELRKALSTARPQDQSVPERVLYAASVVNPVSLSRIRSM